MALIVHNTLTGAELHEQIRWRQAADPGGSANNGDLWLDTDDNHLYVRNAGAWLEVAADAGAHTHVLADTTDAGTMAAATESNYYTTAEVDALIAGGGYTDEMARDAIGAALVAGSNVTITPNDPGDTITIAAASGDAEPLLSKREMQVLKSTGGTTAINLGFNTTASLTGTTATADDADGPWLSHATSGVSGNTATHINSSTLRRDWLTDAVFRVKTGADVTSLRIWIGLFSGDPTASATPGLNYAAFRYDTTADGTAFWRCVTDNSTTPTVTVTTVAVAADTAYTMRIETGASDVKFYINDTLVATHTTTLPGATTTISYRMTLTNLAASSRTFKWSRVAVWHT